MVKNIGFIGLGEMGNPMAKNLVEAGYTVHVFDTRQEAVDTLVRYGAKEGSSLKALAEASEIIIVMVRTTDQAKAVVQGEGGLLASCRPRTILIIMSTISPTVVQEMGEKAKEKGLKMVDAPVSGGKQGAEAGSLSMMVGGNEATFQEIRPILERMGKNIFYMGNEGMGEAAKLANNLLLLINMNAAYEAMNLAEKIGLDLNLLRDLINVSTGGSWVMEHWDMVVSWKENYKPDGTLDLIYKDFQLVFQVAQALKIPLHLGALASQLGRY